MLRKIISFFFFFTIIFACVSVTRVASQDTNGQITIEAKKIDYQLPYPGILPDHPFYFIKTIRDKLIVFFTRDSLQKAQLKLLLSDKSISMAQQLSDKGKWNKASKEIMDSQDIFSQILPLVEKSKEQGVSADGDFILRLKLSNQKHKEIIENVLKNAPQGQKKLSEQALRLNKQVEKKLTQM